jgi:hypothetical protein
MSLEKEDGFNSMERIAMNFVNQAVSASRLHNQLEISLSTYSL